MENKWWILEMINKIFLRLSFLYFILYKKKSNWYIIFMLFYSICYISIFLFTKINSKYHFIKFIVLYFSNILNIVVFNLIMWLLNLLKKQKIQNTSSCIISSESVWNEIFLSINFLKNWFYLFILIFSSRIYK